jgi:hypothetical protein
MPDKIDVAQCILIFSMEIGSFGFDHAAYQFSASESNSNYPFAPLLQAFPA